MTGHSIEVGGASIAVRHRTGAAPGLVWLGGYRSDMDGTKALELDRWCAERGLASTAFDYSGHGASGGDFMQGTISRWLGEAMAVVEAFARKPVILVGSSMGAWIALRMVQERNRGAPDDPVAGLLLLAPAPDFTSELHEPHLTEAQRRDLVEKGYFEEPTPYGPEPNVFTRALFADGEHNRVMTGPIDTHCPVHIIQGQADPDVPWQHAQRLFELLSKDDATIAYIKDGDHRLSRPQDIERILAAADELVSTARIGP
ncbi:MULTISPECIES: alpha/beta hydrolase [unclassified Roseitalea]|uniref:alpha/beta hydrolase n=1 Tax=unclassified Roseitalea TaxID=2639107 RepID=UPI00273ED450|nr:MULTISPECIES: alpha/beta hydrolase [unclassified Roseitalea]